MELWTEKYKPQRLEGVAGNKRALAEARKFVDGFRRGRGLLLHGPTGIGKSLVPEVISRELGYHLVEINASDERGKAAVEVYSSASRTAALFSKGRLMVLDEIDGLSGRSDRGGSQAIANLVKKSSFPVIAIANDPWLPKLKAIRGVCRLLKFSKLPTESIVSFLEDVCKKEGLEVKDGVLKNLARFSDGDLRAALTDLQIAALGKQLLEDEHLSAVGYRERAGMISDLLPALFRSVSIKASRKLIYEGNKDPDDVLWWLENNAHLEFSGKDLERAMETLAKADLFRSLVIRQQNWRFKAYMVDIMAGFSLHGKGEHGYAKYKTPERIIQLARTKQKRALVKGVCELLGKELHCSRDVVRKGYLPYLRILAEEGKDIGLDEKGVEIVCG